MVSECDPIQFCENTVSSYVFWRNLYTAKNNIEDYSQRNLFQLPLSLGFCVSIVKAMIPNVMHSPMMVLFGAWTPSFYHMKIISTLSMYLMLTYPTVRYRILKS